MKKHNLDVYKDAYNDEFKFYDENILMLSWYVQRIIKTLRKNLYRSILSLGIGHKIVSKKIIVKLGQSLEKYLIVEGSQEIIKEFKNGIILPSNVAIVNSLFEEFDTEKKFDAIEMGFVLEHVENPLLLVQNYSNFLGNNGSLFIAVPNAKSLHRLIGHKAGLLDDIYKLSKYDLQYGHKRYFDLKTLSDLILEANLKIKNVEGIMLKPFSTFQLKSLDLAPKVVNSLFEIGVNYPEISNGIYIEATLCL